THFLGVVSAAYRKGNVKEAKQVRERADGRVVAIARHMMAHGGWLTTHEDITDRARSEKRIAFLAQHDLLTGLANRALFSEKLDYAAKRLKRHGTNVAVLMLDRDKFNAVNDTLGHPAGGRNDFRLFESELTAAADRQKTMEGELREAISGQQFELHYQPVIDVRPGTVSGVEAFVRWHHPDKGLLAPDQFLPLAESSDLM